MPEPRLYLYRKAGRDVWDAELWLPDGKRKAWRTRESDRGSAEVAARARLESLLGAGATVTAAQGAAPRKTRQILKILPSGKGLSMQV